MVTEIVKKALYGTPKVGGDILSFCSRCKMELAHVIVSMVDGNPAKVICKTCKSEHKHRKNAGVKTPRASKGVARPATKTQVIRAAEYWEKKVREAKRVPRPYNVQETYAAGDVVEHSKFGPGYVDEVKGNGKIQVFFRDGEKLLIHGMTQK
jgi:hypothetical protein